MPQKTIPIIVITLIPSTIARIADWHGILYGYQKIPMRTGVDTTTSPEFAIFLLGIEQKYQVSLDEVLDAVARFGISKGKLLGYFEVQSYLKKKGLATQPVNDGMVHKWFPA